jgi:hypothetical protein
MGLSKSFPTPTTKELFRVVTSVAVGAPDGAFPLAVAPIAPEPLVPDGSTPLKLITVIEDDTLCERAAVTVTLLSTMGANARQISAVPGRVFVFTTKTQVNPAPVTFVTVVLLPER